MNDASLTISIVTIVRNAPDELARTINSVVAQSVQPFEHIIIDGLSNDAKTVSVAASYCSTHSGYACYISESDRGISDALNKGVRHARGDYILCLNAGDEFQNSDVLRCLNAVAGTATKSSIIYGDAVFVHPEYEFKAVRSQHLKLNSFFHFWNPLCHQAMIVPRSMMISHPFRLDLSYSMDLECWISFLDSGACFVHIDNLVCRYYLGGVSSNPKNTTKLMLEHIQVYRNNGRWYKVFPAVMEYLKHFVRRMAGSLADDVVKHVRVSR